jgi:hypothetical protein
MAKPVSYRNLDIGAPPPVPDEPAPQEISRPKPAVQPKTPEPQKLETKLRERAQAYMVYVDPEAAKTIAQYALTKSSFRNKVKAHDIWLQAMEEFFERNGLKGPVRVREKGREVDS